MPSANIEYGEVAHPGTGSLRYALPATLARAFSDALAGWTPHRIRRLWARDASLWTSGSEANWLGWLDVIDAQRARLAELQRFAEDVRAADFTHALLLGMGGSSLAPEVVHRTLGHAYGHPTLHVLDSTVPAQIAVAARRIDLARTLVFASSKSGTTLEPNILLQYFFQQVAERVGEGAAGRHFVAITDPGSTLQRVAESRRFRAIFFGRPDIGGRYSALSDFGMVPAAAVGVDLASFLARSAEMVAACRQENVRANPGVLLGCLLGALAQHACDKVTLVLSPDIADLGAWLEQLLAESTGKAGHALIPVDQEALADPEAYRRDRLFVSVRVSSDDDDAENRLGRLERAGHPVVRIVLGEAADLGQEFFRWEVATAVAGAVLGLNPFDQPDVEAAKVVARDLMGEFERTGSLPVERPIAVTDGAALYTDAANAASLARGVGTDRSLVDYLRAHFNRIGEGDYFAVLAFLEMNDVHSQRLAVIRHLVRDRFRVATSVGFGPRYLHSTGQAYKGGPNTGVFLQVTSDDSTDLPVPGQAYTFGAVKAAQARGDLQVLTERGRRAVRIHLGTDPVAGLDGLTSLVRQALDRG
jgi:transaldolase/glucose-6-phosphate isomerase